MYNTTYVKAANIASATNSLGDDGMFLAGGMTLIPTMKQRLASPETLVDLAGCNLCGIEDQGDSIKIGAMTRHVDVAESPVVQAAIPALSTLAGNIGDRQVRNRGTIGGSIANNDPSACYPAAALAMNAVIHTNNRDIAAADYFIGMFETALEEGELILAVSFSKPHMAAYVKVPNPASRYAMVGVCVAKTAGGVRVAVTGAGEDGVFRHNQMESALNKDFAADAARDIISDADGLISDMHGSASYRAHLISEITARAVEAATRLR